MNTEETWNPEVTWREIMNAPIAFGLQAQGHIDTIARMLEENRSWEEIGRAIGWCPITAKEHYERHLASTGGNQ